MFPHGGGGVGLDGLSGLFQFYDSVGPEESFAATLNCQKDEQVDPRSNQTLTISLEAKILKLSHFGHIMRRQDSLEKAIILGKVEAIRKRGVWNMRWTDSLKEATVYKS